jgi:hypothetical protein
MTNWSISTDNGVTWRELEGIISKSPDFENGDLPNKIKGSYGIYEIDYHLTDYVIPGYCYSFGRLPCRLVCDIHEVNEGAKLFIGTVHYHPKQLPYKFEGFCKCDEAPMHPCQGSAPKMLIEWIVENRERKLKEHYETLQVV